MRAYLKSAFIPLFTAVIVIQGIHVIEHLIQLFQVYALGVPDDDALGLLGTFFEFQGTEEWLHLVFNLSYALALWLLLWLLRPYLHCMVPTWAFVGFAGFAVGLESWHVVEHMVIISNVVRNDGCPCPGIGDRTLGVTDTVLHFGYNAVAYAATLAPFWYLTRGRHGLRLAMS